MPIDLYAIHSRRKSVSETRKSCICNARFSLVAISLLALLGGCTSKPEVPATRELETAITRDIFAQPDFPQLIKSVEKEHGPVAGNRIRHWASLVERGKTLDTREQLAETNRFFNGARFLTDQEIWRTDDYWATPTEFLIKDAGDCEEFAIAKYFTLRFMGLQDEKMRITYVKALTLNQAHMVLGYHSEPNDIPLILDNLNPRIVPASERDDLVPVYSFNGETLWLARSRHENVASGKAEQIKLWQNLQNKLITELGY